MKNNYSEDNNFILTVYVQPQLSTNIHLRRHMIDNYNAEISRLIPKFSASLFPNFFQPDSHILQVCLQDDLVISSENSYTWDWIGLLFHTKN